MLQLAVRLLLADRLRHLQRTAEPECEGNSEDDQRQVGNAFLQPLPSSCEEFSLQTLCLAYVPDRQPAQRDDAAAGRATARRRIVTNAEVLERLQCDGLGELEFSMRQWAQSLVGKVEQHWRPVRAMLLSSMLDPRRGECVFQQAPRSGLKSTQNKHIVLASARVLSQHGRDHVIRQVWLSHTRARSAVAAGAEAAVGPGTFDPLLRSPFSASSALLHDDPAQMAALRSGGASMVEVEESQWFGQGMEDLLEGVFSACVADRSIRQRS